jgi:hypothetical protein
MNSILFEVISRNYNSIVYSNPHEKHVFKKVLRCKTETVPNLFTHCDHCNTMHPVYKSCKDRMCPICNKSASIKWAAKRESELLSVPYFMLTFTIPSQLRLLFLSNKEICYSLLFKAASKTLLEGVATNEKGFHGKTGFIAMLHSWDQRLNFHPHIHVMVPAGCLSENKTEWRPSHPSFFLPVKRLSFQFKTKLIKYLRKAFKAGDLYLPKTYDDFNTLLDVLEKKKWVVHSQAARGKGCDPNSLIRYLSRYVSKSAVSDKRISRLDANKIALSYYDRKKQKPKREVITEKECMKRLTYHILPKGFKRVRCYGFLANRYKSGMLSLCRMLMGQPLVEQQEVNKEFLNDTAFLFWKYFQIDITVCPDCKQGHIEYVHGCLPGG